MLVVGYFVYSIVCEHVFGVDRFRPTPAAAIAVNEICTGLLGGIGGILAIVGVVVAPITSGDTAFRSARLLLADVFHIGQRAFINRIILALPMFAIAYGISFLNFGVIWR